MEISRETGDALAPIQRTNKTKNNWRNICAETGISEKVSDGADYSRLAKRLSLWPLNDCGLEAADYV